MSIDLRKNKKWLTKDCGLPFGPKKSGLGCCGMTIEDLKAIMCLVLQVIFLGRRLRVKAK